MRHGEDLAEYISLEFDDGHEPPETWNQRATIAFRQDFAK